MTTPQTIGDLLDARAHERGDHPFLLFGDQAIGYAEMASRTRRIANGLRDAGLQPGDRLGLLCANRPEFLEAWFAAARAGAVEVPINIDHRGRFLSHALADSGARYLVAEAELLPHVEAVLDDVPDLLTIVVIGGTGGTVADRTVVSLDELREAGRDAALPIEVSPRDLAVIGYTSGTTGPSKGVMISHRAAWYAGDDARRERGLGSDDVFSTCLPLFHLNAQHLTTLAVLIAGATLALEPRFSASTFWQRMASTGATHFNFIGAMLAIMSQRPPVPEERSAHTRIAFGAPLTPDVIAAGRDRWNLRFFSGYGATEAGIVTYAWADEMPPGSFGREGDAFEVRLADDAGDPVPDGTPGEILTRPRRADSMMMGYWRMPQATVDAWQDLWFHTGDMARRDADGWYFFVDRKKDALRRRGENISSTELEAAIREYPGVLEAAVIGVPSELGEDDVKACLRMVSPADFDAAAFLMWSRENLPRFMVPRYVETVDDFPRTPTQRIEKYKLRESPLGSKVYDAERGSMLGELSS